MLLYLTNAKSSWKWSQQRQTLRNFSGHFLFLYILYLQTPTWFKIYNCYITTIAITVTKSATTNDSITIISTTSVLYTNYTVYNYLIYVELYIVYNYWLTLCSGSCSYSYIE